MPTCTVLLVAALTGPQTGGAAAAGPIDPETLDRWSAPYRGWHHWPDHVIAADPAIPGHEAFANPDVPCVYQLPGQPQRWYMSFIAFNGKGYNSFVTDSTDLVHWTEPRLAMGFGPAGDFDHGGCVIGAFLYESYDIRARRVLKKHTGAFWTLYGCYPRQGGYELRPGYEGVAVSDDGLRWRRAKDVPILAVQDPDCGTWEKDCIYQPWLLEHRGRYFNFYNAANGGIEQTGLAFSTDLLSWVRYPANPVVPVRPGGWDERFASDPKVFRDGDHWTMFYFGVGRGGAHVMIAFSRDLVHWTAHPEPLYRAGGNPSGLDRQYAHKISLVYREDNDTFYMHYCACGPEGRGIGLITSRPVAASDLRVPGGTRPSAAGTRPTYRNPFIDCPGAADPTVLRYEGTYYLYPTTDCTGYDVFVSEDLMHWERKPKCYTDARGGVWAPDVYHHAAGDGRMYLYYTVDDPEAKPRGKQVGVAVADHPLGPFEDQGVLVQGAIDAHLFCDDDGALYLYYVMLPGGFRIMVQPMDDPLTPAGKPTEVIRPTEDWERRHGRVTEGPWMLKRHGIYHLMYSGSGAMGPDYGIGYATSSSPTGPFRKHAGNPIASRGNGIFGPGHHCTVADPNGRLWLVYHQKNTESVDWDRFLAIDPLWFDDSGVIHTRLSRGIPQPAP